MIELNPVRRLDKLVQVNITQGFDERFKEEVQDADPFFIYTHEAHADGIGVAVFGDHIQQLAKEAGRTPTIRGFVMPVAKSLVDGQQSRLLQASFHFFNFLVSRKGLKTYGFTREKDQIQFGMERTHNTSELMPIGRKLQQYYVPAVFAGGSVEAGRHDEGADPESIHGLQRLEGNDLLTLSRLVKTVNRGRKMFFVIVGLHGGFRLQSPNKSKLRPTREGLATYFGVPEKWIPHVQMEVNAGIIVPESEIAGRFGKNWIRAGKEGKKELVQEFNDYIMRYGASLIPPHARGFYAGVGVEDLAIG